MALPLEAHSPGLRPVVQLLALVDPLDQRLAGLGVGDCEQPSLEVLEERTYVRRALPGGAARGLIGSLSGSDLWRPPERRRSLQASP